jgi:chloride channel 3/4/5
MTSRTTSISITQPRPQPTRRPSLSSRLSFAVTTAELGEGGDTPAVEQIEEEEIAEIKRYEVRSQPGKAPGVS